MPAKSDVRRALGRLVVHGVDISWVREVAGALLDLELVTDRLTPEGDADARAQALVEMLREYVDKMGATPSAVLLRVVLALDEPQQGLSALERRTIAGQNFRGGQRTVSAGTIRQYHEPRALDRLADLILEAESRRRDELELAAPTTPYRRSLGRLGLVDQQDLLRWADTLGARGDFPRLVRRLILETTSGIARLGFPAGEGIASAGWDGTVLTTEASAFVPSGLSVWELSTNKNVIAKASSDYAKRTQTPDGSPTTDCIYVSVSLRRFPKRGDWEAERRVGGRWGDVRALGVDELEMWLDAAPITHAWISELLGYHPHGLVTVDNWWTRWSSATEPLFPAQAVLAGREQASRDLRTQLSRPGQIITIEGPSHEDVLAFVAAFLTSESVADSGALLSRSAFVDQVEAWRRLNEHSDALVLVAASTAVIADIGGTSPHHIIVPVIDGVSADISLPRISSQVAEAEFKQLGLKTDGAANLARVARSSLLAARRTIATKPDLLLPSWAAAPVARSARRVVLAGRWDESSDGDTRLLDSLLGASYRSMSDELDALVRGGDPLLARIGTIVGVVSGYDAWRLLRRHMRTEDLALFQRLAVEVLGERDPALDLPPADRWRAALLDKKRSYSKELRRGVANTLALLGTHGDLVVAGSHLTSSEWAEWIVRTILESANADPTSASWASLEDVMPLLAEAAPSQFLSAVRTALVASPPLLHKLFVEETDAAGWPSVSPGSSLLRALETCAWSPSGFGQAVDLLSRLAELDPDSGLNDLPKASLESIFRPWYPQNSVSPTRRLAALDGLRDRQPRMAWALMLSMLPDSDAIAVGTNEPRYRDWKPERMTVTAQEYWGFVDEVCRRLLEDVDGRPNGWQELVGGLSNLPPATRRDALSELERRASDGTLVGAQAMDVWESLRSTAARHREYAKASWALPEDEIEAIERVATLLEPSGSADRLRWLFDDHMPEIAGVDRSRFDEYSQALQDVRTTAARQIAAQLDYDLLREFAVSVELPWFFGRSLAHAGESRIESEILRLFDPDVAAERDFALGYASGRYASEGWAWIDARCDATRMTGVQIAWILLATADFPTAWERAEEAGTEVSTSFWAHFVPMGLGVDFQFVELVAAKLLEARRPHSAVSLLALYSRDEYALVRAELMASGLEQALTAEPEDRDATSFRQYELMQIFNYMERSDLPAERVAQLEWAYLPAFGYDGKPGTLSRYLAEDAGFFADVICQVYKPRLPEGADDEDLPTDDQQARATNAYRLLSQWRTVPGSRPDGTLDGEALNRWVDEARSHLRGLDRAEIGDVHIGQILAASPPDSDGNWPAIPVRNLLERLQASDVEDGLRMQLYNDRGVTSRGMLDGGEQERALVSRYRDQAEGFIDRWPRIASVLNELALSYERDARRLDADADRRQGGFER